MFTFVTVEIDITDRIEQILKEYNLTPSAFSDMIQVQRSALSHILSRRNRPSLDVIQKILKQFPEINSQWILTGTGQMKQLSIFDEGDEKAGDKKSETRTSTPEGVKVNPTPIFEFKYEEKQSDSSLDYSKNVYAIPPIAETKIPSASKEFPLSGEDDEYRGKIQNESAYETTSVPPYFYKTIGRGQEKIDKEKSGSIKETTHVSTVAFREIKNPTLTTATSGASSRAQEITPNQKTEEKTQEIENEKKVIEEAKAMASAFGDKEIARIVIFYKDKTFSSFTPE